MRTALGAFEMHFCIRYLFYLYIMHKSSIFIVLLLLLFSSCKQYTEFIKSDVTYYVDDDKPQNFLGQSTDSIFKVIIDVELLKRENISSPLGIQVTGFGAFDVYWDGVFVGRNGKMVKSGQAEIPGTEMTYYQIPEKLANLGKHTVTVIGTQVYLRESQRGMKVKLESFLRLHRAPLVVMSFMNLMAGAFLIASIYYFFLYINSTRKEATVLLFGIICLLFFCLLIVEYVKFYIDIPYTHFYTRLQIVGLLTFIISILVPWYFMLQFDFKRKQLFLFLLIASLITIYIVYYGEYDRTAIYFSYAMCIVSFIVAIDAAFRKIKGGLIVVIGLLVSVIVNKYIFYDFGLFIAFTIIVLLMLYLHTIRAKALEEAHNASLLLSSRLQLELVKKNIQPHFLRNTLTSLIDWIEESPQQGVVFIRALADEFDIMNSIAEDTLIPIQQEIELCRKHLEVMSFRKEVCYNWEEKNIDANEEIPPAVIHTIIENGITHSLPPKQGCITFSLSFNREKQYKQYTLFTIAKNRNRKRENSNGTGFKYIKARLNENYGSNWEFDSFAVEEGWCTTIKIFAKK
ncbi:Sensor histidine kinase YesM [Flavobacterium resistens]|uniref:Sensor histidine kinase YesM n=2 Tax=Flavobacterium resistens TaxID=443612 RepID=A0A521ANC4_9FLAO|nr:histidine kinase [Flavobacterium resistens]SMO36308.1 Sensor histidine kinase YesM [Flavobacterium resistens]